MTCITPSRRWTIAAALIGAASAVVAPCVAQEAQPGAERAVVPYAVVLSAERARLPEHETLGLVGVSLLFAIDDRWAAGPAVYGAATGHRGGLFVGGLEVLRVWQLNENFSATATLFAGGGGGAAAPVGNGLMLRPSLGLWADVARDWSVGATVSAVRFPGTAIRSTDLGLAVVRRSDFFHLTGSRNPSALDGRREATGLGFDRISATATHVRIAADRSLWLVGGRAERRSPDGGWSAGVEGAAAAQGTAAGYMELLGDIGVSTALLPDALPGWRVGARAAVGLGGGGNVVTGGGLMAKATLTTEWTLARGVSLMADIGAVRAGSQYRATLAQVALGVDLEPRRAGRATPEDRGVVRMDWTGNLQHHDQVLRRDGSRRSLDTIGLKIDRWLGDNLYVTGQAHSAFAGQAGAFSIGLLGLGVASSPLSPLSSLGPVRIGADALVGAAGGGGVAISSGGIAQGQAWASLNSSARNVWRVGIGKTRALRGGVSSTVLDLSFSRSFGMAGA